MPARHTIGGYGPFKLDGQFAFSDFAGWGGGHNAGFAACVEACRGGRCALDVGAHIGLVTLPIAAVLAPGGVVIAFEPAIANRTLLERHAAMNGLAQRVRVEGLLVGDREDKAVSFFQSKEASGMNTVVDSGDGRDFQRSVVPQTSLDAYCERFGHAPEVVKIDVEGAEVGVLEGARNTLITHRPLIFLSIHPQQIAALGRSMADLVGIISELRYDCFRPDGTPATKLAFGEYLLRPRQA